MIASAVGCFLLLIPPENSVSSIGKMLDFYPDIFGDKLEELFRVWISWLPLEFDEVEARACHKHLCSFITRYEL